MASSPSGTAEEVEGVLGGIGDHERLRVGQADVLDRHADDAAGDEEPVLAAVEHAREIVERRVGVGAAHRLVQRRDQIVVARPAPCRRSARGAARSRRAAPASNISPGLAARQTSSARVRAARPSPSAMRTSSARGPPRRAAAACPPAPRRASSSRSMAPPRRAPGTSARGRATGARALSSKDGFSVVAPISVTVPSSITGRKLSCWARLKRWISSTNSSVPCPVERRAARLLEDLLQFGDAGEDRRDLDEGELGLVGQQARRPWSCRCRAGPRRSASRGLRRRRHEQAGQRAIGADQMVLPGHLRERRRAAAGRRAAAARRAREPAAPNRSRHASPRCHDASAPGSRVGQDLAAALDGELPVAGAAPVAFSGRARSRASRRSPR